MGRIKEKTMLDKLNLIVDTALNSEIFLYSFVVVISTIIIMTIVVSYKLFGFKNREDRIMMRFFQVLTIIWVLMLASISFWEFPEDRYEEISVQICVSKTHDTKKMMGEFYKDKEITFMEYIRIGQEFIDCNEENGVYENDKKELLELLG